MTAALAFFAGPIGRWIVVAALVAAAAFAAAVHERNIGWHQRDLLAQQEQKAQAEANLKAATALNAKYRQTEKDHAAELAALGADYEAKLATSQTQRARDVAAARAGSLRLSIPSACPNADRGAAAQAAGSAGVGDDPARTFLPNEITGDLFALADDADAIVIQLTACQAVINSDRKETP